MKTFDRNNLVLEFTVYFLCPGDEDEGWDEDRIARRVGRFNAVQRNVVADFFRAILENDELYLYHPYAKQGLTRWSV